MSEKTSNGGISFCGLLGVCFIVLKLTKIIDWSWIWVLAPLWIPVSLTVILAIIAILIVAILRK